MNIFSGVVTYRIWNMALVFLWLGVPTSVQASSTSATNPVVQFGSGTVAGLGTSHVTVNQATPLLGINWNSLGNNPGEVLKFVQPSTSAIALNRIAGGDPSQFLGSLSANGSVIVINPNGVFFGPQSQVNVNGLIASSLNMTNADFLSGRYVFQGGAANGTVRNEGQITAGPFGVYLLAPNVTNNGVIRSPEGNIALAAGTTAYLSNRSDGRGLLVEVKAPAGEALNLNSLIADGGQVSMIGRLVTQSGVVQANSVKQRNGKIELIASARVTLTAGSVTSAKGDAPGVSDGGTVRAIAEKTVGRTSFDKGAIIDVSGGVQGGNAGFVELSGAQVTMPGSIFGRTAPSYRGGTLLIDPTDLTVDTAYLQTVLTPKVNQGMTNLAVQADNDLTVTAQVNVGTLGQGVLGWTLPAGQEGTLLFDAGHNLTFNNALILNGLPSGQGVGSKWTYNGKAGNDIVFNTTTFQAASGGSINLQAGQDIKLVPDGGGGLTTLRTFTGGNITIDAGRDLIAPFVLRGNGQYAGIRLQGVGNLNLTTGRDFLGGMVDAAPAGPGFLLSNGTATVNVGVDKGGNLGSLYVPGSVVTTGPPNGYATFMLGSGTLDITTSPVQVVPGSQGIAVINVKVGHNIYLGNMQDTGVAEGYGRGTLGVGLPAVNPASSASLTAQTGNIFLNPLDISPTSLSSHVLPPNFTVAAPNGNIFIQNDLDFWPSAGGNLAFSAGNNIQGALITSSGGDVITPIHISLCESGFTCPSIATGVAQQAGSINFTTTTGDISGFNLELFSPVTAKSLTISSGRDIRNIFGQSITVPDLGTDAAGNPIPGATISAARDIDMTPLAGFTTTGFTFLGTGTAKISAGRNLDLASSQGIIQRLSLNVTTDANKGGLLDISVGGDLTMTQSRILTENGANVWIHGIGRDAAVDASGTPTLFNGQSVVVQAGTQQGAGGNTVVVGGNTVLLNGKPLVLSGSEPVITSGSLLLGHFPAQTLNGNSVVPVLYQAKPVMVNGKLVLLVDGQVTLVDARTVSIERPVGGQVLVGANQNSVSNLQTGILTNRGGAIQIKAMGDVDVQLSRIASFGGGNITIASKAGDINAGSGGKDQSVFFVLDEGLKFDAQGNPVIDPGTGQQAHVLFAARVPGSGVFTFHPDDPFPLKFPVFNPISPFEAQVDLHQFFGHDVTTLLPKIPAAHDAWIAQYNQIFDKFIAPLKLDDVTLSAARDVVVPPAGIRGRLVTINAGRNLDLNGGTIEGRTNVTAGGAVVGSLSSFVGAFTVNIGGSAGTTGNGGALSIGSISGSVGTVTTSSAVTASASVTSATTTAALSDAAAPQLAGQPKSLAGYSGKKGGQKTGEGSLRIRDKVKIKVETKPEKSM